ncbi:MAG: ATP-binding protein [Phycisphaerae bacterium]
MESEDIKQLNVLIVEDDRGDAKVLHKLLLESALPVSNIKFAERLQAAFEILEKEEIDVIFLDLGLPDSTGIDSIGTVNEKAPNTPIIVLSGLDDAEIVVKAVHRGVEDYLVKGNVDPSLLARTVRYAIEHKQTKKTLAEKQKNIEAIFDAAPVGMILINEQTIVRRVNNAIVQMLKKDYKDIVNKKFGDALGCVNIIKSGKSCGESPCCEVCKLHTAVDTVLKSKQSVHELEIQPSFKIGDENTTQWFRISGEPLMIDGRLNAVIAVNNITESKIAERERRLAEERYRTIFENSAVAISLADENERLVSWNKFMEDLLGMDKEDLNLKPVRSLYPEGQWQNIRDQNVRQRGMQHHLETQMLKKNGDVIDVNVSLSVIRSPEGKVMGSIGVITDITERKKAERELKETMEIKSQFISTVSHELRTPLTSMKESITIVADEIAGKINADQKNFLNIAKRNVERLSRLINEVLDFQKLSANKMKMDMRLNDIKDVVKDVHNTMIPHAKQKNIHIAIEFDGDLPQAVFDNDRMIQVLTNLINNAIKFTPEKGKITVLTKKQGDDISIRVSDTGMGMPKEALSKIFDQFYQVYQPNQQIKGTGLGLSIVKKIIEMHNGRVEVESELEKGTAFTVFLPLNLPLTCEELPEKDDQVVEKSVT